MPCYLAPASSQHNTKPPVYHPKQSREAGTSCEPISKNPAHFPPSNLMMHLGHPTLHGHRQINLAGTGEEGVLPHAPPAAAQARGAGTRSLKQYTGSRLPASNPQQAVHSGRERDCSSILQLQHLLLHNHSLGGAPPPQSQAAAHLWPRRGSSRCPRCTTRCSPEAGTSFQSTQQAAFLPPPLSTLWPPAGGGYGLASPRAETRE